MAIITKKKIIQLSVCAILAIVILPGSLLTGSSCNYFDLLNPYGPDYGYWAKSYGGLEHEHFKSLFVNKDETALLAGTTDTYGKGDGAAWLVTVDRQGQIVRQQTYDFLDRTASVKESFSDLIQGTDGRYLAIINLLKSDTTGKEFDTDFSLLCLNNDGEIVWYRLYTSNGKEQALAVQEVPAAAPGTPAGLVVTGYLDYNFHFMETPISQADLDKDYAAFVMKLSNTGVIEWQTILRGGPYFDEARTIVQTKKGGFIVGGNRTTDKGDSDYWLFRLDNKGMLEEGESITFGGAGDDYLQTMVATSDDGLLLAGISSSVSEGVIVPPGKTHFSHWLLKLDSEGSIKWQKKYAETEVSASSWKNYTNAVRELEPDLYLLALTAPAAASNTADLGILKLDKAGNIIWQKLYGGADSDEAVGLRLLPTGGYLAAGQTRSFSSGGFDFWTLKLLPNGYCPPLEHDALFKAGNSKVIPRTMGVEIQGTGKQTFGYVTQTSAWKITKTECTVKQQAP